MGLANGTVVDITTTFQNFTQHEILDKVSPINHSHILIELTTLKDSIITKSMFSNILEKESKNNSFSSVFSSPVSTATRDIANLSIPTK